MTKHSIIAALTLPVVALTGCSDDLNPDLVACKTKTKETYPAAQVWDERQATYLRECMIAEGWPLRDACLDTPQRWDSAECYLR